MLCEVCGKNQATFFYKQTKNGYTSEKNLCTECASAQGLGKPLGIFESFSGDDFFGGLLGSFVSKEPKIVASETCRRCGMTLGELLNGGRVGCSDCYTVFRRSLIPTVTKIHGNVAHCGKTPATSKNVEEGTGALAQNDKIAESTVRTQNVPQPSDAVDELDVLKKKLYEAIELQEYEDAAKYRDAIREIEAKRNAEKKNDTENEGGDEK